MRACSVHPPTYVRLFDNDQLPLSVCASEFPDQICLPRRFSPRSPLFPIMFGLLAPSLRSYRVSETFPTDVRSTIFWDGPPTVKTAIARTKRRRGCLVRRDGRAPYVRLARDTPSHASIEKGGASQSLLTCHYITCRCHRVCRSFNTSDRLPRSPSASRFPPLMVAICLIFDTMEERGKEGRRVNK